MRTTMTLGLGRSGIARRVFVVGAIPILVAAVIAIGAVILLHEADRARAGAVVATETAQTLTAMNQARVDAVSGNKSRRDEAEGVFNDRAAIAKTQLDRLAGLARTRGQSALVATVMGDLISQVTRMRSLILSERKAAETILEMSRRADALVTLTDEARRRQQQDNARLITVLADKDGELERNQEVVTALRELREAIGTAELNRARVGRPVFPVEFEELAGDMKQLETVGDKLRRVLRVDGEAGVGRPGGRTDPGLSREEPQRGRPEPRALGRVRTHSRDAGGRELVEWCDKLVQVNVARQNRLYEEVAGLIRHSVLSNEAELSAQDIALTALRLARQIDAALARRDTAEASRVLRRARNSPIRRGRCSSPRASVRRWGEAIDGWRTQLAATIGKIGEQNDTIADMDRRATTMTANARP